MKDYWSMKARRVILPPGPTAHPASGETKATAQ